MWLINVETFALEYFPTVPSNHYAILSHTWEEDEVLFKDMDNIGQAKLKKGWRKIQETCRLAHEQSLSHAWLDTCCIDKSSSADLSEAINSMFNWYRDAKICFVHLSDLGAPTPPIPSPEFQEQLARCRWFTRGWTLQELICPSEIEFLDTTWNRIGTKTSLQSELSSITGVDAEVLQYQAAIFNVPVGKRMSFAAQRTTTRGEDIAYCLLGIFQVHMPLLYGEGAEEAFLRLQEQIVVRNTGEMSLFAWNTCVGVEYLRGAFASSPAEFKDCRHVRAPQESRNGEVLVFGNSLELNEPIYNTVSLGNDD